MTPPLTREALVERIARAMFDCYGGYNDETRRMMWAMAKRELKRKATRALAAIHEAGLGVVALEVDAQVLGCALPLIEAEPSTADKRLGAAACLGWTKGRQVPNEGQMVTVAAQLAGDYRRLVAAADIAAEKAPETTKPAAA